MPENKLHCSFVTPWFGDKIPGGAEAETRHTAQNLAKAGVEVTILTTCLEGLGSDWDNDRLPAGESMEGGLKVLRFPTAKRNPDRFNSLNERIIRGEYLTMQEEQDFYKNMIYSPQLLDHMAAHPELGPFFFIPYLFTSSVWGPLVHPEKSVLIPCLHDEGYARMAQVKKAFESCRAIAFHVQPELDLASSLYDLSSTEPLLLGEGVDTDWSGDGDRFRQKYNIQGPFALYAGRKDAGKNTPLLTSYFQRYLQSRNGANGLKLYLIGNLPAPIPTGAEHDIIDLGFVPVQDKYDAYAAADIFIQPSMMESFSIVIMESWLAGTPVMVHTGCAVTRDHTERSGGGLHFLDYPSFAEGLDLILGDSQLKERMGQAGRSYVLENYSWPKITQNYMGLIEKLCSEPTPEPKSKAMVMRTPQKRHHLQGPAVHQMLPDFAYGDAIGNDVLAIQKLLRSSGISSDIYARHVHPRMAGNCNPIEVYYQDANPNDILIFHFSTGHPLADAFMTMPGRKVLRYHNITPAKFLAPSNPQAAERAEMGRAQLPDLAAGVELGLGVSPYNCQELEEAGCNQTDMVPILLDLRQLETPADPMITERFSGQRDNVLHVGRIAPNKRIEDLIKTQFWLSRIRPGTRLLLVGGADPASGYRQGLSELINKLGVPDVHFSGHVTTAALMGYYQVADLYLCLSEHEGFCVPLVESMHFGLPIVALAQTGVPGTLGEGGVLLDKNDPLYQAELIASILEQDDLRQSLAQSARDRLERFRPENVALEFKTVLVKRLGLDIS
jgi:glycosyltransferase involved in cell wall biosynthesis